MAAINLVSRWGRAAHKKSPLWQQAGASASQGKPAAWLRSRGSFRGPDGAVEAEQSLCRAASAAGMLLPLAAALYSLY